MRLLIDNIKKQVAIDGVQFPVTSPDLGAGIDNVFIGDDGNGAIQITGGFRTTFIDPSPYQGFVNAWMTANVGLTLAQAKTIKSDLVSAIYFAMRQRAVSVSTSPGTFNWDGSDAAALDYAAMAAEATTALLGSSIVGQVNATLTLNSLAGGLGGVSVPSYQIIPVGSSTPLTVTANDIQNISAAVRANRRGTLTTNLSKQAAIAALSTVAAVIAFDATTGW
jgi:hypothetical protein